MIDTPDKYKLTEVVPGNITGKILPAVDGTPEAWVLRHENLSYLTEMCREINWLAEHGLLVETAQNPFIVLSYDKDKMVLYRRTLDEIAEVARNRFHLEGWGSGIYVRGGVIPTDWALPASMTYPVVTESTTDAMWPIRETMGLERADYKVSTIPVGDEVRLLYRDLAKMKRFYGVSEQAIGYGDHTWERLAEEWETVNRQTLMLGPCVVGDGNMTLREWYKRTGTSTSEIRGYTVPYVMEGYDDKGETTYTVSLTGDLAVITALPRMELYDLGENAGVWLTLKVQAVVGSGSQSERYLRQMTFWSAVEEVGGTEATPLSNLGKKVYRIRMSSEFSMLFQIAKRWMEANVMGSTGCTYFSVELAGVAYDTGVMLMRSEIDSTGWDWEPQGE